MGSKSRYCRGQNTIEYILLVVAVLGVFILFLKPGGAYKARLDNILFNSTVNEIQSVSDQIQFNHSP